MLQQGDLEEIRPFFRVSKLQEYVFGIKDLVVAFLGVELLTIFPLSGKRIGRSVATASLAVLSIGLFYVLVVETSIMLLGMKSTENYNFALIEAIKQIDNPIIERFDILFLTVGFAGLVAGICGVYLALVEYAIRLFKKISRVAIVVGVGFAVTALGILAQTVKSIIDTINMVFPVVGLVAALVIPAILLSIAKVRGLVQKPR